MRNLKKFKLSHIILALTLSSYIIYILFLLGNYYILSLDYSDLINELPYIVTIPIIITFFIMLSILSAKILYKIKYIHYMVAGIIINVVLHFSMYSMQVSNYNVISSSITLMTYIALIISIYYLRFSVNTQKGYLRFAPTVPLLVVAIPSALLLTTSLLSNYMIMTLLLFSISIIVSFIFSKKIGLIEQDKSNNIFMLIVCLNNIYRTINDEYQLIPFVIMNSIFLIIFTIFSYQLFYFGKEALIINDKNVFSNNELLHLINNIDRKEVYLKFIKLLLSISVLSFMLGASFAASKLNHLGIDILDVDGRYYAIIYQNNDNYICVEVSEIESNNIININVNNNKYLISKNDTYDVYKKENYEVNIDYFK